MAKACFEKIECQPIKMFKISAKVDQALRRFYLVEELVTDLIKLRLCTFVTILKDL